METITKAEQDIVTTVSVPQPISARTISGLLCGLFENGCSSWLHRIVERRVAPGLSIEDFKEGGRFQEPGDYFAPSQIIPTIQGCSIVLRVDNPYADGTMDVEVDRRMLANGLQLMAILNPYQFRLIIDENDDATTADVFGQMVVYGEEVYC